MANPNIVNVTTIQGKVTGLDLTTTGQNVVINPSGSGKIFKINNLTISNIDGTNNCDVYVNVYKNQSTPYYLASTVTVPADASLIVISKDTSIYLEENDSLRCWATATGDLQAVCSYEEIS